jgi:pyrimidine oxygenase
MIKLRGFGGKSGFWDQNLESFTLMAGLASITKRIKLYATVPTLVVPPAIAARMVTTIDSISNGRFGLNVITGWQRPEYSQMGLWPGDEYFAQRYDFAGEYVQIMQELWTTGRSNFKGRFFQMDDCRMEPRPQAPITLISAGQSDAGMKFIAKYADYNFVFGMGYNTPAACAPTVDRLQKASASSGRKVATYGLFMVITGDTDEEARAKWRHYQAGADDEALRWLTQQSAADTKSGSDTNVRHMSDSTSNVNLNIGLIVGSPATCARLLDEVAAIPGMAGVLLTFDEFVKGTEDFGRKIQPLMKCRRNAPSEVPSRA